MAVCISCALGDLFIYIHLYVYIWSLCKLQYRSSSAVELSSRWRIIVSLTVLHLSVSVLVMLFYSGGNCNLQQEWWG